MGSSPLARGTPGLWFRAKGWRGLIPARAGNTTGKGFGVSLPGAHPRSRGEHLKEIRDALIDDGSSPLARGTLFQPGSAGVIRGLIPARAGNTPAQ